MSSATNLPPPYLFLDFQFPAQEKSENFPYKVHCYIESRGIRCVIYTLLVMDSWSNLIINRGKRRTYLMIMNSSTFVSHPSLYATGRIEIEGRFNQI